MVNRALWAGLKTWFSANFFYSEESFVLQITGEISNYLYLQARNKRRGMISKSVWPFGKGLFALPSA